MHVLQAFQWAGNTPENTPLEHLGIRTNTGRLTGGGDGHVFHQAHDAFVNVW